MSDCKHPVSKLDIITKHDSSSDGYGGTDSWDWEELTCTKCEKMIKLKEVNSSNSVVGNYRRNSNKITENEYFSLTGRRFIYGELKKLYNQKSNIYEMLKHNNEYDFLKKMGIITDDKLEKLEKLKKSIKRAEAHLRKLENNKDDLERSMR